MMLRIGLPVVLLGLALSACGTPRQAERADIVPLTLEQQWEIEGRRSTGS